VLEPLGLVVHGVDVEPESARKVELEQPMVADHLDRDLLARRREADAAVRRVLHELERRELLDHRAGRRRRDFLLARERRHGHPPALRLEVVQLLQVVLDRVAQGRLCHARSVRRGSPGQLQTRVVASGARC
jgi:hypothetical protein